MNQRYANHHSAREADGIGLFGKIPTHGDFVSTGLSRAIETELANWLQAGLQESEQALGQEWHRLFRAAPPWRFVIEHSVWSEATMVGVLLPSRDRVGRSFPLVLAAKIGNYKGNPRLFCFDDGWFAAAEALAETSTLHDFDINGLIGGLRRLRLPNPRAASADEPPPGGQRVSLWWTVDAATGHASGFRTKGPPGAQDFLRLLKGGNPTVNAPTQPKSDETVVEPAAAAMDFAVGCGYATHAGTRLSINADALLISESPRLFVIADGVGDGGAAVEAAKITTNTLAQVPACDDVETLVQEVKGKLGRAHSLVQSIHKPHLNEAPSASVVALALQDDAFVVIWAGNARCYLLREGMMRCLTRDHVEIGMRFALSRSVGSRNQLIPEMHVDRAQSGDRLLLCSAALSRTLEERSIAGAVLGQPAKEAATALIQDALIAHVRDNVSAIVVTIGEA